MATRNFWVEANIEGRKTVLKGGPRAKDGGFVMRIYMRVCGEIQPAMLIVGYVDGNKLRLVAREEKYNTEISVDSVR